MSESVKEKVFPFGESDFLVEEFNPEQFLAKYASSCELDELKGYLAEFVAQCERAITNIMNTDYESFVSLAMRLKGLKEKLQSIKTPLEESKEQMQEHKKTILRECESLAALLKRYQELEERKQHLSRFLSINAILTQSEAILRDLNTKQAAQFELMDMMQLERVCRNYTKVELLLSSYTVNDYSFLIMCKDRNEAVKKTLLTALRAIFDRNVQGSAFNKRLHLVLKCYLTLNMVDAIEAYYRENFVAPFLDSMITREKVDGTTRNSCSGLDLLLNTLFNYINNNCRAVLLSSASITVRDASGRPRCVFDFLLHAIWFPIVDYFFRRAPHMFTCGSHSVFQSNYALCDAFATKLAALARSPRAFWEAPKTVSFYGSWEVAVYVSSLSLDLMTAQLAALLKKEEKETTKSVQEKSKQGVAFRQTSAATTYALACQCFAPDVFIGRCCKDLTQLALALVAAFFNFVRTTLQGLSLPTMEGITASATAQPATPTTPTTPVAINDATTAFLVDLLHDVLLLQESLRGRFVAQIAGVLGGAKQVELVKRAIECLLEKEGSELIGALYQGLLVINLYNASSSISNARSVTSSYRMTNKPSPSAPSFYVSRILYSFEGFDKKYKDFFANDLDRYTEWKQNFISEVCRLFYMNIEDILKTISRMEEVLSKHRIRNSLPESGERHQLLLDVTALKSHISEMGLEVPASYNDVFTLVSNAYYAK
ncbi:oligomeric Golgi complex subunit 2 [Blastocystis sp. ATCC 50177/Nand II]|uniref:Conserved oligomeric Golgi complex subunit 2 n=1 Tax=Blastocystis sp. subtype 1 (strain ATCC 50177 / NandII) TaxID=478820 RepID=A0A196S736_BLAHN|nr:oligomeric Golgi complex subunit 2 [Blastocystis sp. ATCC 50177/Nand II]